MCLINAGRQRLDAISLPRKTISRVNPPPDKLGPIPVHPERPNRRGRRTRMPLALFLSQSSKWLSYLHSHREKAVPAHSRRLVPALAGKTKRGLSIHSFEWLSWPLSQHSNHATAKLTSRRRATANN